MMLGFGGYPDVVIMRNASSGRSLRSTRMFGRTLVQPMQSTTHCASSSQEGDRLVTPVRLFDLDIDPAAERGRREHHAVGADHARAALPWHVHHARCPVR